MKDWDEEIRSSEAVQRQAAALIQGGCDSKDVVFEDRFWSGTSPFCAGSSADCHARDGMVYVASDGAGDGAACLTGQKVLCARATCAAQNPEFNPRFLKSVIGTAPFCASTPCDCYEQGALPWRSTPTYEGRAGCTTGAYQVCLKPLEAVVEFGEAAEAGRAACRQSSAGNSALLSKGFDLLLELAKKIPAPI